MKAKRNIKALVEQSLLGITIIQDNRIVFTNEAFAKITGYSEEELCSFSPGTDQSRSIYLFTVLRSKLVRRETAS